MQCADGKTEGTRRRRGRREVVPGMSSLTTCDELREARSEIKRVPENLRGSARSNYLHEARGVRTVKRADIFFSPFFYSPVVFAVSFSSSRLSCDTGARDEERPEQKKLFWITFCARLYYAMLVKEGLEERTTRDVELTELNTTHKLRADLRETRRTADRNLISLANEFLSKSRVSRLM